MNFSKPVKEVLILISAVYMYAIAGRITMAPAQFIEITAQSLIILTGIYLLPRKLAVLSIVIYLSLGVFGLPIFKDGASGIASITGKTGGYLIGFFIVSLIIKQFFHDPKWSRPWYELLFIFCLATAVLLVVGTLWLSTHIGVSSAIKYGLVPFLLPGFVKSALSMILVLIFRSLYIRLFELPVAQS